MFRADAPALYLLTLITWFAFVTSICHADDRLASGAGADRVVAMKKERTLLLLDHGAVLKKYRVALGGEPVGPKRKSGDHKTPEGIYVLDRRNETSRFYRSLHISYPRTGDRERAAKSGVDPGGQAVPDGTVIEINP